MVDTAPEHEFLGVTVPTGGQFRIRDLSLNIETGEASIGGVEVRWDMWSTWLAVAVSERDHAAQARAANPGPKDDGFGPALVSELTHAMTSICAAAFTLEAFTNSVAHYLPHTVTSGELKPKSAAARIHAVWLKAFKLSNAASKGTRQPLGQIFHFRNQAVHSPAAFTSPVRHGVYPVALERRYVMFGCENADAATRFAHDTINYLTRHPRGSNEDWLDWCEAQPGKLPSNLLTDSHDARVQ